MSPRKAAHANTTPGVSQENCYYRGMNHPEILKEFRVVLCRPKSPGNVGSVARAMKNMGFARLCIADPIRYDDSGHFVRESARMAWGAADLLEAREEYPTVAAAVADATLLVGTTARPPRGRSAENPRELAGRLVQATGSGPVALLFGQEDIGLSLDVLARCPLLGVIPSDRAYGSLNLAQAVLIFLYEIRLAALNRPDAPPGARLPADHVPMERDTGVGSGPFSPSSPGMPPEAPPTQSAIDGCFSRFVDALDRLGFFAGTGRDHKMRELRSTFGSVLETTRGVRLLEGIVHRIRLGRGRSDR